MGSILDLLDGRFKNKKGMIPSQTIAASNDIKGRMKDAKSPTPLRLDRHHIQLDGKTSITAGDS